MLTKILFREYDYPNNVINTTRGSAIVTGRGTKFTEIPIGTALEAEGFGFIGKILSVESDISLTLDRAVYPDLSGVIFWQDWSIWRTESGAINRKVESDNPGEAGVVVFDNVSMTFYMGNSIKVGGVDCLNPVKAAFNGDLDSKKRYVVRIMAVNYDFPGVERRVESQDMQDVVDNAGQYIVLEDMKEQLSRAIFGGVIDFSTISKPFRVDNDGESFDTISFEVVDKLSTLNTLATIATRTNGYIYPGVTSDPELDQINYYKWWDRNDFGIYYTNIAFGTGREINDSNAPALGDLVGINFLQGMSGYDGRLALITFKYLDTIEFATYGRMYYCVFANYADWNAGTTDLDRSGHPDIVGKNSNAQEWIDSLFNGEDIFITQTSTKNIKGYAGITAITGDEIIAIDGVKLIAAILKQRWPDVQIVNKLKDGSGDPLNTFPLPLNFIFQLLDEFPLGKEPLEAVSYIVNAIDCYIFTNLDGNFVLQNNNSFEFPSTTPALTIIDLDALKTKIKSGNKKEFWDKLVDSVVVNVTSWIPDPGDPTAYLDGAGYAFKVEGIKPRNEMVKDVIIDQATLDRYGFVVNADHTITFPGGTFGGIVYPALTDQSDVLNQYGDFKAIEKLNFYGKRHECYDTIEMIRVAWDMLLWELLFLFAFNGKSYFMTNFSIDLDEDLISFTMPSVTGYDYNLDNVIIGKARDEYLAGY